MGKSEAEVVGVLGNRRVSCLRRCWRCFPLILPYDHHAWRILTTPLVFLFYNVRNIWLMKKKLSASKGNFRTTMKISHTIKKYVETNSLSFKQRTYQNRPLGDIILFCIQLKSMTWTAVNSSVGCRAQLPVVTVWLYGSQFPQSKNSLNRGRY